MFVYTLHALAKLKEKDTKLLKITKKRIEKAIKTGVIVQRQGSVTLSVGDLDKSHSLCVVHRKEGKDTVIITFFAAKKGRYEGKILS